MGNQNSAAYSEEQDEKATKIVYTEPTSKAEKVPMQRRNMYTEEHGNKPLYNDDTFTNYIQRAKNKIRSLSTIGRRHEEHHPRSDVANVESNQENEKDKFSDFIQNAKKKLRTMSTMGKSNSFRKGKKSRY